MIGKRPTPVIGISPVSGNRTVIMDGASSPRSPLDLKIQSLRGVKGFDFGGVGLAVVASLDDNKYAVIKPVYNTSSIMSISIPVNSVKFSAEYNDNLEDYTVVTCRGGDKRKGFQGTKSSVFDISPAKFVDLSRYPDSDFLNSCHLCNKKLHGKDIFMYRGEKAFCSTECRCRQIVMDEHKEKCTSQFSTSTYANGQIFSTGILAL